MNLEDFYGHTLYLALYEGSRYSPEAILGIFANIEDAQKCINEQIAKGYSYSYFKIEKRKFG